MGDTLRRDRLQSDVMRVPWRFVLRWQLVGMVTALLTPAVLSLLTLLARGTSVRDSLTLVWFDVPMLAVLVVAMSPLSVGWIALWTRLVATCPELERTAVATLVGWIALAGPLALTAGAVSSWEELARDPSVSDFVRQAWDIGRQVFPWAVLGLIPPRLIVRSLRPSALRCLYAA